MRIEIEEPIPVPTALAFTLLRIVTGVILAAHGLEKLDGFAVWQARVTALGIPWPELAAPLAIAGELLGGLGLIVGLFTRLAAIGGLCVMAVAIAFVHAHAGLFARDGGFEYPLLLAAATCLFVTIGGGRLSLDHWRRVYVRDRAIARDRRWSEPPYVPYPRSEAPLHSGTFPTTDEQDVLNTGYRD